MNLSFLRVSITVAALATFGWGLWADEAKEKEDVSDQVEEDSGPSGIWHVKLDGSPASKLTDDEGSPVTADLQFPGAATVYLERDRRTFRPKLSEFQAAALQLEVKVDCQPKQEVKGNLFIQNKDGLWFQSQKTYRFQRGEWLKLSVPLAAREHGLQAVGHNAVWSSLQGVTIFKIGVSLYSSQPGKVKVTCRNLEFTGERSRPKLAIIDWQMPERTATNEMIESRFRLSREYFNPFDPDEIKVDVVAEREDGRKIRWPAFFAQGYEANLYFNREMIVPAGKPFWAFRFTPSEPGSYKIHLEVTDKSTDTPVELTLPARKLTVGASDTKGFVRVAAKDHRYFELTTGEFFYPIGFNLHTVKDLRSERCLKTGSIPDKGIFAYERYFQNMSRNGVNLAEVWMCAWSVALEWTSAWQNYYGVGRYNLYNAWRLDQIVEAAKKNGIYLHLVLDNHGKLAEQVDREWHWSPFNVESPYAKANGAFLKRPRDFFTDKRAKKYNERRNRYIAGRWGGFTNIFGIEFWSEIDLVTGHGEAYRDGDSEQWHKESAQYLASVEHNKHVYTTHFCSDYNKIIGHRRLYELDEIDYIVCDAYRNGGCIVDHMRSNSRALHVFDKPVMITEYGGSPHGADFSRLEADLHGGIWASFFVGHAGTPLLWWHDFVDRMDNYQHFAGFAKFFSGIDPRGKKFESRTHNVSVKKSIDTSLRCLSYGNQDELYGWVYHRSTMVSYPEDPGNLPQFKDLRISLAGILEGKYSVQYYDTLTGKIVGKAELDAKPSSAVLELPPFAGDIAFKVIKKKSGKEAAK